MRTERYLLPTIAGALLCGCGGGPTPGGTTKTGDFGDARVTYSGSFKPNILSYETGLSISSAAGITISSLTMDPAPSSNNEPLYYTSNGEVYSFVRGQSQLVFGQMDHDVFTADVSTDGHIYFTTLDGTATFGLARVKLDGTGYTLLQTTGIVGGVVRVSPDSSKVVYNDTAGLEVCSSTGTNKVLLDAAGSQGCFSPDGTKVAYIRYDGSHYQIWTIPVGGGTPTKLTSYPSNLGDPSYDSDGNLILAEEDNGSLRLLESFYTGGTSAGGVYGIYDNTYGYATGARISPDGKYIAALTNYTYGATPLDLTIEDLSGNNIQTIAVADSVSWPGFPPSRTFIGASGIMATSANGFIYSQFQPGFASLVTFSATTASTATATLVSSSTSTGPAAYDVHGDSITSLKYANGYWQSPVSLTPATTDALVSIDSTTGLVTTVSPYIATRGQSLTQVAGPAGMTFKAHFLGVWNATGQNVAPQGASSVVLDNKHGTIVAVH